jgi:hypothetical protein
MELSESAIPRVFIFMKTNQLPVIIALIAVEVILALIREGPELAEWTHGMLFPEPTLKRQEGRPA